MPDFCRVESNQYHQVQCFGCRGIGRLFAQLMRGSASHVGPVQIHSDFRELAECARRCVACQVFQRALLLEQITVQESEELYIHAGQVWVTLERAAGELLLCLQVRSSMHDRERMGRVICSSYDSSTRAQGVPGGADWAQLRGWISACDKKHACRRYRWSNTNPTWLVQVLPGDQIQLVRGSELDALVPYVALSYCWGNQKSISAKDPQGWEKIQRAHTRVVFKGQPVSERVTPFSRLEYPRALQDAIHITQQLGLEYIWIDSVCIPEQDDWNIEAGKMHEVYGNAHLTLYACAADKAIDPLCTRRLAWEHPVKACRLFGYWMTNMDPSLSEVRVKNPLSLRGWILQEERLSPRILFWCAQRAYWSCCERHATESRQSSHVSNTTSLPTPSNSRAQDFMMLSHSGDSTRFQEEWLDLVASYTRRSLAEQGKKKDRFKALSGLAVRYLSSGNQDAPRQNEYLAGLWRQSFARDLAWRLPRSISPDGNLRSIAPSWSWASLPLRTDIDFRHPFDSATPFQLLEESGVTAKDTAQDIVAKGALIHSVTVRGRLRKLIGPSSIIVPWDAVITTSPANAQDEMFEMPPDPGQAVHARSDDGRIVVYEAHKEEIMCRLDYLAGEWREESANSIPVGENEEADIYCLEIGKSTMLLLKAVGEDGHRFERVGIGIEYRRNFFHGYDERQIVLE